MAELHFQAEVGTGGSHQPEPASGISDSLRRLDWWVSVIRIVSSPVDLRMRRRCGLIKRTYASRPWPEAIGIEGERQFASVPGAASMVPRAIRGPAGERRLRACGYAASAGDCEQA